MSFFTAFFQTLASMQTPEMYSIVSRIIFSLVGVVFAVVILALFIIPAIVHIRRNRCRSRSYLAFKSKGV
jgi:hypothetical protein